MRRDLERRLKRLELRARPRRIEIWVDQGDGTLCSSSSGECMTRETFDRLHPPESDGVIVMSPGDARL